MAWLENITEWMEMNIERLPWATDSRTRWRMTGEFTARPTDNHQSQDGCNVCVCRSRNWSDSV